MLVRIAVAVAVFSVACGDDDSPTPTGPTVTPPTVTPPTVTPPAATLTDLSLLGPTWFVDDPTLEIGERVQLNVDAEYSDGTTKRVTDEATWASSNDHVATVVDGLITGRNLGGANVSVEYEGIRARSISFRVERGAHVTVSNVRAEHYGRSYTRVTGTVRNTGSRNISADWEMRVRFYTNGGSLLAEDETYSWETRALPTDDQQVFEVTAEIRSWGYYTLQLFDGTESVPCAGCADRRR